ncbi:uncharacterized protein PG986_015035 [Apiospora aurea]|uniref:Uncharacterized protein n=1 Tax=Apiospora aurea TaxID=335848 RepID=A0ABR1PRE6_9PEZI
MYVEMKGNAIGTRLPKDPPLGAKAVRPPPPVREVEALEGSRQDVIERDVGLGIDPPGHEFRPQHADVGAEVLEPRQLEQAGGQRKRRPLTILQGLLDDRREGRLPEPQLLQFGATLAELGNPGRDAEMSVVHHGELETGHVREHEFGAQLDGPEVVVFAEVEGQVLERRGHVVDEEDLERDARAQLLYGEGETPQGPTGLLVAVPGVIITVC